MTQRDPRGWPLDPNAPQPPHTMVLEGDAIDALVAYALKWKPENDRIEAERKRRRQR